MSFLFPILNTKSVYFKILEKALKTQYIGLCSNTKHKILYFVGSTS